MSHLIIVAGCMSTGTSLMMKCLKHSGFELGEIGGSNVCENRQFNAVTRLLLERNPEGIERRKSCIEHLKETGVEALKINALTLRHWMEYEEFANAKFIRTLRYGPSVVESLINRKKCKTKDEAEALYRQSLRALSVLDKKKTVKVWYEDMFIRPEEVAQRLASFLDIEEFSLKPLKPHLWHYKPDA